MTAIAGFQCPDGILLCADSEETLSSDSKSQARKIKFLSLGSIRVLIGDAGTSSLIEYSTQELIKRLINKNWNWDSIEVELQHHAKQIFRENIRPYAVYPRDDRPEIQSLIAVQTDQECRLFKWTNNFVMEVPRHSHTSIGFGIIQSERLITAYSFYLPFEQMLFFAVRIMKEVKETVRDCGGNTEVRVLRNDGTSILYSTKDIHEVEYLSQGIDDVFSEHVLTFICNPADLSETATNQQLKMISDVVASFRRNYKSLPILLGNLFHET